MTILVGEIGGETKLALFSHQFDEKQKKIVVDQLVSESELFPTKKYECDGENGQKTLNTKAMIEDFLNQYYYGQENKYGEGINQNILGACFGIAGPVDEDNQGKKARISRQSLGLEVSFYESDFKKHFPCPEIPVSFLNDMVAIGKSFIGKPEDNLTVLHQGKREAKPTDKKAIMLVAGGLGQALWLWNDTIQSFLPVSSEGGHSLFAPRNEEEMKLWLSLLKNRLSENGISQPVSYEYVLSEPGIVRIYHCLKANTNKYQESEDLKVFYSLQENQANPSLIIQKAVENSDTLAVDTINIFLSIMGARAGDLALTYETKGGIYINDLIPLQKLQEGVFTEAFLDKEGNFRNYNDNISVKTYPLKNSVLWGAANYAVDSGFVTKGKFAYKRMNRGD